jgi:hypothetical protein
VDEVVAAGARVIVRGWSDIPATVPGRVFRVMTDDPYTAPRVEVIERIDVARVVRDPRLVLAGFRLELDFASASAAQHAAAVLCLAVEAPGHPATVLSRATAPCPSTAPR